MSPESKVYLCDKLEDLGKIKAPPCRKDVAGDDQIELLLTVSGGPGGGAVYERKFCGTSHATFWLIRQRLVGDATLASAPPQEELPEQEELPSEAVEGG